MSKDKDPEVMMKIHNRPMSDLQRRAWDKFWNEIIDEVKTELISEVDTVKKGNAAEH
jgi:hypothetical protein